MFGLYAITKNKNNIYSHIRREKAGLKCFPLNSSTDKDCNYLSTLRYQIEEVLILDKNIEINKLADMNNMSLSAFHKNFKQIVGQPPLQCIKKTRLTKAKTLIELKGLKANIVANMVGYESYSQFSREYKRMFDPHVLHIFNVNESNLSGRKN